MSPGRIIGRARLELKYQEFVNSLRLHIEMLARASVFYDTSFNRFTAKRAVDWADRETCCPLESEHIARCGELLGDAQSVREVFGMIVSDIENDFAAVFSAPDTLARFKESPDLLFEVFRERGACSSLWNAILERDDAEEVKLSGAAMAPLPLPSRSEVDTMIAHGIKLLALMDATKFQGSRPTDE